MVLVVNGQAALSPDRIAELMQRAGVAALDAPPQIHQLPAAGDEPLTQLAALNLSAGQRVVLIPPDDAQTALGLAAAVYHQTGQFPVIIRAPGE